MAHARQDPNEQSEDDSAEIAQEEGAATFVRLPREWFTHVAIAGNVHEVLLTFGRADQLMNLKNNSLFVPRIEWVRICTLTPVAAKVLAATLKAAVTRYEDRFGVIPDDPVVQIESQDDDGPNPSE
jgi:hypothetical protein